MQEIILKILQKITQKEITKKFKTASYTSHHSSELKADIRTLDYFNELYSLLQPVNI